MVTPVGGLRSRLLKDSLFNHVEGYMRALGWFDAGRQHLPFSMAPEAVDSEEKIPFNTLAISDADMQSTDWEMGSLMSEERWTFYFDFYGENDAVGLHVIQDVKAILEGRFASLGQRGPSFPVYDYQQATPPIIAFSEVENVDVSKAQDFPKPWQRHWYAVRFDVLDYVTDDLSTVSYPPVEGGYGGY